MFFYPFHIPGSSPLGSACFTSGMVVLTVDACYTGHWIRRIWVPPEWVFSANESRGEYVLKEGRIGGAKFINSTSTSGIPARHQLAHFVRSEKKTSIRTCIEKKSADAQQLRASIVHIEYLTNAAGSCHILSAYNETHSTEVILSLTHRESGLSLMLVTYSVGRWKMR